MNPQAVIDAGFFDAMIRVFAGLSPGELKQTNKSYLEAVRKLREGTVFDKLGGWSAWREVAEQARLAVNRAKRMEREKDPLPAPKLNPIPGEPGNPNSKRAEYHVIVIFDNPATGGSARFPVVVTDDGGLTHQQVALLAALAGVEDGSWSTSGQKGEITPETAVFRTVIVLGIVGSR